MSLSNKIRGFGWLLCLLLPALSGVCLGSPAPQDQGPPTVDLENQPTTYNYPQAPRRRRRVPPNQPQNFDPSSNPNAASAPTPTANPPVNNDIQGNQANPSPNGPALRPRPQTNGPHLPPSSTPPVKPPVANVAPAQVNPAMQTGRRFIGPPAPVPLTPEQMAPSAPTITYQGGLLSVESTNSKLSDILSGIRARTGIQFEGAGAASDRVAGKFGPAPTNEVLTNLLQGSRFDYVIVGSPENPDVAQRVILTPAGGPATASAANQPATAAQQPSGDEDEAEETPVETQPVPAPVPQQASQVPPPVNGPKTTEQVLQELKEMQAKNANQQNADQTNPSMPPQPVAPMKRPLNPQ